MRAAAVAFLAVLASALARALPGVEPDDRAALARRALDELHQERFNDALTTAAELRRLFPEDPAGPLFAANVHQTMMRDYRLRDREVEFREALAEAQRLAERAVRARPNDAEAFFARATARGYVAIHEYRCGRWLPALRQGLRCLGDMRRAADLDPAFVDPLLPMALHDYWKSRKLGLGVGLFGGGRRRASARMEAVWRNGRFLTVEAAYSLSTLHQLEGRFEQALEVNDWLYERFPANPVCLYHRARILEGLDRPAEALAVWERLVDRIGASGRVSHGFLAECHLHRARVLSSLAALRPSSSDEEAAAAVRLAVDHARRWDPRKEMEGPFGGSESLREEIARLERRLSQHTLKVAYERAAGRR